MPQGIRAWFSCMILVSRLPAETYTAHRLAHTSTRGHLVCNEYQDQIHTFSPCSCSSSCIHDSNYGDWQVPGRQAETSIRNCIHPLRLTLASLPPVSPLLPGFTDSYFQILIKRFQCFHCLCHILGPHNSLRGLLQTPSERALLLQFTSVLLLLYSGIWGLSDHSGSSDAHGPPWLIILWQFPAPWRESINFFWVLNTLRAPALVRNPTSVPSLYSESLLLRQFHVLHQTGCAPSDGCLSPVCHLRSEHYCRRSDPALCPA